MRIRYAENKAWIATWSLIGRLLLLQTEALEPNAAGNSYLSSNVIMVVSTPIPTPENTIGRRVEFVEGTAVKNAGATGFPQALESLSSVSVNERGGGMQADLSVRGSTFEQVLVTLDGLPVTDPQTAHHNMDIPLPPGAVQRMTVVSGPGSALFGPTAFAGVVDITPARPDADGLLFSAAYGDFDTFRLDTSVNGVLPGKAATVSASYANSDGFEEGTDYSLWSAWGSAYLDARKGGVRMSAGHIDKEFGAKDFYAPYPSKELTATTLFDLAPWFEAAGWTFRGIARYREHDDEFILKRDDPDFYLNRHETRTMIERVTAISPQSAMGTFAVGVERADDRMESSNLGDRKAFRNSVFLQHRGETGGLSANLGLRMDDQNRWGTEVSPSASVAFTPVADLTLRVAGARGIRPPSFTERYYRDPRNTGNPDLQPEQSWGYEAGFDLRCPRNIRLSVTGFRADAEDLIDWTRSAGDQPWVAMNISKTVSQGVETSLAGPVGPLRWQLSYCYLDLDVDSNGLESKYALNAPQHDTRLGLTLPEWNLFSGSMHVRYRDVPTLDSYSWVSARMARRFGRLTAFVQGQNLLDEDYEEIPGVPTSGRYTEAGVEMRW